MILDLPCTANVSDTGTWDARAARRLRVGRVPRVFPKSGYEQEKMSQNEVAKCDETTNMIETFPLNSKAHSCHTGTCSVRAARAGHARYIPYQPCPPYQKSKNKRLIGCIASNRRALLPRRT